MQTKTCSLNDFMEELSPWLSKEYIREAYLDEKERFVVLFLDNVKNVYQIDDCTAGQLKNILNDLKNKGVNVPE